MSDFQIARKEQGGIVLLQIAGKLDAKSAPSLSAELKSLIGTGKSKIVCDMSKVSYIASAGVGTLKAALVDAKKAGGDVRLAALQKEVKDVFDVLGFTALFTIGSDVASAAKGL